MLDDKVRLSTTFAINHGKPGVARLFGRATDRRINQQVSRTMKLNEPRLTLIAGLALAVNLPVPHDASAANGATKKAVTLVRAQSVLNPIPASPAPPPALTPIPQDPTAAGVTGLPQPPAPSGPGVVNAPMQMGSQPALAPVERMPMGLHYGEAQQLQMNNPTARPTPLTDSGLVPTSPPAEVVQPYGTVAPPLGVTDQFHYAPPPGTLGQTYQRRTRPIEDSKHPRVGIVEVNLPENVDVTSLGLKTKWTGKVWRLESDPLLPGVPHIYQIKASWGEGTTPQVRTIRLIMGRIVDLDF